MARGPYVNTFRDLVAKTYGAGHVVTTSSGTTAIHVALATAGVEPGDEVIVPPLTDHGSVIGIFQLNAVPVFCDTIENSLVMDVEKLESVITNVGVADTAGMACDTDEGLTYHLEATPDLVSTNYSDTGAFVTGSGGPVTLFDPSGTSSMKNYRVVLEL